LSLHRVPALEELLRGPQARFHGRCDAIMAPLVQPRGTRVGNLWVTNAIIEDKPLTVERTLEEKIFLREYSLAPVRLDWPAPPQTAPSAGEVVRDRRRARAEVEAAYRMTTKRPEHSTRFKRQRPPKPFNDGFDIYLPRRLHDIGDLRVTVLRRWLGVKRFCFWTLRQTALNLRPAVDRVEARVAVKLREKMFRHWTRRLMTDFQMRARVLMFNRRHMQWAFDGYVRYVATVKNCKALIGRYYKLKFGQAFYHWVNNVSSMKRFDELVEQSVADKKRSILRAIQIHATRRKRVKERAAQFLIRMLKFQGKIMARWRNHASRMATKRAAIYARTLSLRRRAFAAWKSVCFFRVIEAPKPLVITQGMDAQTIFSILSKPGRLPAFITFSGIAAASRRASAVVSKAGGTTSSSSGTDETASLSTLGSTVLGGTAEGTRRETTVLSLDTIQSRRASSARRSIAASEVFRFGDVQIFSEARKLSSIQTHVSQVDKAERRASVASPAGSRRQSMAPPGGQAGLASLSPNRRPSQVAPGRKGSQAGPNLPPIAVQVGSPVAGGEGEGDLPAQIGVAVSGTLKEGTPQDFFAALATRLKAAKSPDGASGGGASQGATPKAGAAATKGRGSIAAVASSPGSRRPSQHRKQSKVG
jgi:hypothetical protein